MPGLKGYEVCRRLRAEAWGQNMLIVALTGWGQEDVRRKASEAGFDRHQAKPVDHATLTQVLADAAVAGRLPMIESADCPNDHR